MKQEYREALDWLRSCESDQLAASEDPACSYAASQLGLAIELLESCAIDPIPLSERMPGPDDMDGGLVWAGSNAPGLPYWEWCIDDVCTPCSTGYTHWLPASTKYLPARVEG